MELTTNFQLEEFACHDAAKTPVPSQYLDNVRRLGHNLQVLRDSLKKPIHVLSGYRTPEHNREIGGVPHSQHLVAKAADLQVEGFTPTQLAEKIKLLIGLGKMMEGGIGIYPDFVHYDIRGTRARW